MILAPLGSVIPGNLRAMATAIAEFDPNNDASVHDAVQQLVRQGKM